MAAIRRLCRSAFFDMKISGRRRCDVVSFGALAPGNITPGCAATVSTAAGESGVRLDLRRAMDGGTNALVGATPADVAGHGGVDVGVAGLGRGGEQGRGRHD